MTGATPAKSASVFDHGFLLCGLSCSSRGCAAQKRQPANATLIGHFKGRVIRNVSHASPDGIPVATTATLPGRLAEPASKSGRICEYAIDVVDGGQRNLVVATVPGDLDDLEA
jgi:hypothetical protein